MSCNVRARILREAQIITVPMCLALAACGGSGGGSGSHVASTPPPPMPTPTPTPSPPPAGAYPLTRAGTYDLIGALLLHPVEPGPLDARITASNEFTLTVSPGNNYDFEAPAGFLPGGLTGYHYDESSFAGASSTTRGGYAETYAYDATRNVKTTFGYDAGFSYVSMGEWEWSFVHLDGGTAGGFGRLLFVGGDRTPSSGIPASGTATYDAHTFALKSSSTTWGIPFSLTADFGQRTISTSIDQNYQYDPTGDVLDEPIAGIHVAGSAPFDNSGTFDIPLAGTVNYNSYPHNTPETPPTQDVSGDMNGAFFGPHAEQVGGVLSLGPPGGTKWIQDAFVGKQRGP